MMARFQDNYFQRRQKAEEQQGQKTYNLQQASREKYGLKTDWEVANPVETERETTPAFQNMIAPTTNPKRPRALKLAYSRDAKKLVVKFRDGTWWEYNDIDVVFWNDLKASNSTGKYLAASGLDNHDDMGPFNPGEMPPETRVIFNS
jgi:hypothetical protein